MPNTVRNLFSSFAHPNSVCMTYFEHFFLSMRFAGLYTIGAFKAVVHAFIPSFFVTGTRDTNGAVASILSTAGCR